MNSQDKYEMGNRLKMALKEKGMKQIDLVKALNDLGYDQITDKKMSDFIHGRRSIFSGIIFEVADILEVDRTWLSVGRTENDMCTRWK